MQAYKKFLWPIAFSFLIGSAVLVGCKSSKKEQSYEAQKNIAYSAETAENKKPELPKLTPKPVYITEGERIDLNNPQQMDYVKQMMSSWEDLNSFNVVYAAHVDLNNDGKKELAVIADYHNYRVFSSGENLEKGHFFNLQKTAGTPIKSVKFLDLNNDGNLESIVGLSIGSEDCYFIVEKNIIYYILSHEPSITDLDGDGFPEIYDAMTGQILEADYSHSSLSDESNMKPLIEDAIYSIASAGSQGDMTALGEIDGLYPDDVMALFREILLNSPEFQRYPNYNFSAAASLKELFLMDVARYAAADFAARKAPERERERIRQYGGNPDIHVLQQGAEGPILREKPSSGPPSAADQHTVSKDIGRDRSGTTERREISLTPEGGKNIRQQREQKRISKTPGGRLYKGLEDFGRKVTSPFDPQKQQQKKKQ
jgi:hypothetical protein